MQRFDGKTAVVTGSSRGIGRGVAEQLAELGANVVVNYVSNAGAASEAVNAIRERGGAALAIKADVSLPEEAEALIADTIKAYGGVHILVNNAGITRDRLILRMNEQDWDEVLDTNLKGAFLCTKAVLRPMMRQRWGRIVNIASIVSMFGNPGQANYTAAKSALIALTRTTAVEMASKGITANAVAPGFIVTQMTEHLENSRTAPALQRIPVGRGGSPTDVAAAVIFFASEAASYITGQVLAVDGGLSVGFA